MNDEQRATYATFLIKEHASDVEYLTIFEMAEDYGPTGEEISEEDASAVRVLINRASVEVAFVPVTE